MCQRRLAAIAAVLVLAVTGDAFADALADARNAIDASDYETARTALDKALQSGTVGPAELAEIYKLTGIVEGALGNERQAEAAFASWIALDPKASLPFGTSPKIMRPFDEARANAQQRGRVEVKAETEDDPPAVTLVVVNDPQRLIAGARVHFTVDKGKEQTLSADGTGKVKIELGTGKRIDLRLHAVDRFGNRVAEIGSKDVPIVITSSGTTIPIPEPGGDGRVVTPATPPKPRPWYWQWWVWGAGTIVATGVGGYFAWRTREDIQELDYLNANSLAYPWSAAQEVESRARRDLLVTNISAGVAGALAIGTAILYLTRPRASRVETRAAIAPIPGGGALVVGATF